MPKIGRSQHPGGQRDRHRPVAADQLGEGIFLASMGTLSSPGTFGGMGFGGQLFWVDPERELTFVHLVCGYPQIYNSRKRSQRISDQVISSVTD